jgi:RNA polymerase sigma-70 factor (ECF subfamily)
LANLLTYTDRELLIAVHKGDTVAFQSLYFRYFPSLCRYAYKKIQDESIVEEIVQDVFIDIWRKRQQLDLDGEVAGLLYAMLRNKALHVLRARMIQSKHIEEFTILHKNDHSDDLIDELYARQVEEKMQKAIEHLSPQCREAFTLSRYENLSYKQIAIKMDISINTVEKHIGKALHILRKEFKEYHIPGIVLAGLMEVIFHR